MSDRQIDNLLMVFISLFGLNLGNFLIHNYDKILGSVLTALSICYLLWKWRQEYKKSKIS